MVKVRDGQVRNKPIYAAIGVTVDGHKDILGMWAGDGDGESAKFWLAVLTELRNRGVQGRLLPGLRWFEGPSRQCERGVPARHGADLHHPSDPQHVPLRLPQVLGPDLPRPAADLHRRDRADARDRFEEFAEKWGTPYPAIKKLWENAWEEFIPFLDYDVEIRKVLCSTNAIESLNARYRRAVRARGHFPNEQSAMKMLYLVTRSLDPRAPVRHDG